MYEDFADGTKSVLGRVVSAEIRARMAAQRISGKALARKVNLSQNYLATRLRDEKPLNLDDLEAILKVLAVDLSPEQFLAQAMERQFDDVLATTVGATSTQADSGLASDDLLDDEPARIITMKMLDVPDSTKQIADDSLSATLRQ